jgi:hypothetical protein
MANRAFAGIDFYLGLTRPCPPLLTNWVLPILGMNPRIDAMPSLQESFPDATPKVREACCFYDEHYSSIGQWLLEPGKKIVLRSSQAGTCRFCGLSEPKVKFRDVAHAIPECIGNRSLTTDYECDECNALFGAGIETDFGYWSKAQRTMSGIRGKKGVPAHKGPNGRWRFEHRDGGFQVTQDHDPIAVVNEDARQITLTLGVDTYTPIAVLKAFTKMALSLLPDEELSNFRAALAWIRNTDHQVGLVKTSAFPVLYTFVPGNNPLVNSVILLRRRADNLPVPYVTFVLTYGNEVFQIIVPSPERDTVISAQKLKFPHFPNPYELDRDLKPVAPMRRELIDLTGRSLIKGETLRAVLRYELRTPNGEVAGHREYSEGIAGHTPLVGDSSEG